MGTFKSALKLDRRQIYNSFLRNLHNRLNAVWQVPSSIYSILYAFHQFCKYKVIYLFRADNSRRKQSYIFSISVFTNL